MSEAPVLPSWKENTDCCAWEGVTCDGSMGQVTALDLSELGIVGNLSSAIFNLTSLRFLNLAGNCFLKEQGSWLTRGYDLQLPHLEYLNLSNSCFFGFTIPIEKGQLPNLVTLDLSMLLDLENLTLDTLIDNLGSLQKLHLDTVSISVSAAHAGSTNTTPSGIQELSMQFSTITGPIDTALSRLRSLSKLTLDYSSFGTPITVPEFFAEFSSLKVLSLKSCCLIGTFPSRIFNIRSLTVLDLSSNLNLTGELPEFMQNSTLEHLIIGSTKFAGKIPASTSNLHNLSILDLSNCQFHGHIPSFAQWPNIQLVDLSRNNLTGSLASDGYLALHNLTHLNLESNMLSGDIPAHLFSHPSLQLLLLSKNRFTGNFLLYHNSSSSMRQISVSDNKLQGPIPKFLSKFVGLERLDLSSNNFTGTIDLSLIKNYVNMSQLSLSNNKLSVVETVGNHSFTGYPSIRTLELASCSLSNVPRFLMHLRGVETLDLSNNNIAGHIPDWIWGVVNGSYNLSHNLFTSVGTNLPSCTILDLHSNNIRGTLPLTPKGVLYLDYSNNYFNSSVTTEFWSSIGSAIILLLSNNSLTGEVPDSICNAKDILVLDLSFNSFSGLIPPCLLDNNNILAILNLRGNSFHGPLPQNISKRCALAAVDLNGNKLEGKLPVSLVNCRMLHVLDLGSNQIVDTFPEWLGVLALLKVLVLRSNRFHGHIDHHYWKDKQMDSIFPALQILDLSSNDFSGTIPTPFLKQLKAMMPAVSFESPKVHDDTLSQFMPLYKNLVTVMQKGLELTLVNILSIFTTLDLSNNNFEGTISDEIGDLKSLKGLNLSRNLFSGEIPTRIASMLQLESLDLSYNQLSGEIPPRMALMSFLEVLNLSYNHLSGRIPQSNQFLTFQDTSFLGNDGLCGKPLLLRPCDTNHTQPDPVTPDSSQEVNWNVLSVEVGVIWGLAIVVGTTLLWSNGRRWAYWHVDKFLLCVLQPWIHRRHH